MSGFAKCLLDSPCIALFRTVSLDIVFVKPKIMLGRSVGSHGQALTDAELEWAVLCLEEAEARTAVMDFSAAAGILETVLGRLEFGRYCRDCLCRREKKIPPGPIRNAVRL